MKLHDLFSEASQCVRVVDTGAAWQVEINGIISAIRYGTKSAAEHRAAHLRTLFTISRRLDRHLTGYEEHQIEQHTGRGRVLARELPRRTAGDRRTQTKVQRG